MAQSGSAPVIEHPPTTEGLNSAVQLRSPIFTAMRRRRRIFRPTVPFVSLGGLLLIVLVASFYTAATTRFSLTHGRLQQFLTFDDLVYLTDGATRLEAFNQQGMRGLVLGFYHDPPHSPYQTLEAFFSFMVCGQKDWAPYAGNVVLVLGFMLLGIWTARGLRWWHKGLICLVLLTVPLVPYGAMTCRPDFAAALLLTAGILVMLAGGKGARDWVDAPIQRKVWTGVFFGAALLAKPSVFASIIVIFLNCVLVTVIVHQLAPAKPRARRLRHGWLPRVGRDLFRASAVPTAVVLAVAGSYFLVAGAQIWNYVWDNMFGVNADIWKMKGTLSQHLWYYITASGGEEMLGRQGEILEKVLAIAAVFYLGRALWQIYKRQWNGELLAVLAIGYIVLVSFLICVANQMKHIFLGLNFQVPMVFLALGGLSNMVLSQRLRRQLPWAEALLVLTALTCLSKFQWPDHRSSAAVADQKAVLDEIARTVDEHLDKLGGPVHYGNRAPTVLVTFVGNLNSMLLNYTAMQRHDPPVRYYDLSFVRSPDAFRPQFDSADFVVLADQGMERVDGPAEQTMVDAIVPSTAFQGQLLDMLRARKDFKQIAGIEYPINHRRFYVFQRLFAPFAEEPSTHPSAP